VNTLRPAFVGSSILEPMRTVLLLPRLFVLGFFFTVSAFAAGHGVLWGRAGENWSPQSRLPDFSFAGYHCGEAPLPVPPRGVSIRDFGAKGDGVTDDTQAFLDAIARAKGVIEIPPGRYKITKILEVTRSGVVLRGAGADKTTLFFPIPLNDIRPNWGATTTGQRTSNYSWSGGFLWFRGAFRGGVLATVTAEAPRGATSLRVSSTAGFQPGRRIQILQRDPGDHSLTSELYSGDPGDTRNLKRTRSSLVCRVTRVQGDTVHFDRPLRCAVKPAWTPQVLAYEPSVTECGVENVGFEFPVTPYKGHFTELGFNAVAMTGVADCWGRNLRVVNADSGVFVSGNFCTVQNITFASARPVEKSRTATGHHGFSFSGDDNLLTDFHFQTRFMHDITVSGCAGNVSSRGEGPDICFDHHKYAPHENLFTDIDLGAGTRPWQCGGGAALGKHTGARETFWNLRSRQSVSYPPAAFGPASMNLVGIRSDAPSVTQTNGQWFETIRTGSIHPPDLHAAQLERRLRK
jgi:hypothetical protein